MSVLEILKEPDPILRKKSDEVSKVDNDIRVDGYCRDDVSSTRYWACSTSS